MNREVTTPRILFATDYLHVPQGNGGAERNTHELCLALRGMGVVVAVTSSLLNDGSWLSKSSRIKRKLTSQEFAIDHSCGYPVYRGWDQTKLAEVSRSFQPDVIVLQSTDPAPLLAALSTTRIPVCCYFHEVERIDHLGFLRETDMPLLANSGFTAQRLFDACGLHCQIVLPIVDKGHYVVARRQPGSVLFVNTIARKGVEKAFAVAAARPDIPFSFILSWIHKEAALAELHRRAEALGNVTLHPPTQDMRPHYGRAKILLAPSQWEEAWGRVATEAHVNGIPVIGSDRGGLTQAIGPGGIVVPHDAPTSEWTNALASLWDDDANYAAASAASRIYSARPEIQPGKIADSLLMICRNMVTALETRQTDVG